MLDVYFDTNVYNNMLGGASNNVELIARAVSKKNIRIIASLLNFQEIALVSRSDKYKFKALCCLLRRITFSRVFVQTAGILRSDFENYLKNRATS